MVAVECSRAEEAEADAVDDAKDEDAEDDAAEDNVAAALPPVLLAVSDKVVNARRPEEMYRPRLETPQ
jgi:hypothetical protein